MRTDNSEFQAPLHQMLRPTFSCQQDHSPRPFLMVEFKARQSAKIREMGEALIADGIRVLDQQAKALGLSRSTTWTILKANHKSSGLSAAIINRMLAAPQLPPRVRLKIFEYIQEKSVGRYGDNERKIIKFTARISADIKKRELTPILRGKQSLSPSQKLDDHGVAKG
jgi:predicted DNA-binding transcriptional regulator AlpA